jgi:hypothetical protein
MAAAIMLGVGAAMHRESHGTTKQHVLRVGGAFVARPLEGSHLFTGLRCSVRYFQPQNIADPKKRSEIAAEDVPMYRQDVLQQAGRLFFLVIAVSACDVAAVAAAPSSTRAAGFLSMLSCNFTKKKSTGDCCHSLSLVC